METKDIGKYRIKISPDETPENPRTCWDNMGTMVCFHGRYNLGDKDHGYNDGDHNSWAELSNQIQKDNDVAVILPIYMYDHSGITIKTSPFGCRWDSGQIGFIFITKEKARKERNWKRLNEKRLAEIEKYLDGEVETYDQFLTGDVYGYEIFEVKTCNLGDEHEVELDSCWGFYGEDYCMEEAERVVKYYTDKDSQEQPQEETIISN